MNYSRLIFWHLFVLILLLSFLWEGTSVYWNALDVSCFRFLNNSLEGNLFLQKFWAFGNLRIADWIEDAVFILFFTLYVRSFPKELRTRKICEVIIAVAYCAFIILYVNHGIFRTWGHIDHLSPSMALDGVVDVSHVLWTKVKTGSAASFPGDHGTTALFFPIILCWLRASMKMRIWAWSYAAFLCLPRMIVGAHWLSDIIVGSSGVALIFSAWLFCTPLLNRLSSLLERGVLLCRKKSIRNSQSS